MKAPEVRNVESTGMKRIQQLTVVSQVMDRIKHLIASGTFRVNERIPTENQLATMFGVGRSSVREAIKIFQHLGILEVRLSKGTFVCNRSKISSEAITWSILLGQNSVEEILQLRQVIEERGVTILVGDRETQPATAKAAFKEFEGILTSMRTALSDHPDIDALAQADYDFHARIVAAAKNSLFDSIFGTLHSFLREEIRTTYLAMKDISENVSNHQMILDAMRTGTIAEALEVHRNHFKRIRFLFDRSMQARFSSLDRTGS